MSFRHRTTTPIPSATASRSLSITWVSTRANLSGCHRRNAARILSFCETSGECADDSKNSRIASWRNSASGRFRCVPGSSSVSATTGHGIRSNVSALSRPSSGCRWLNSAHRASYVRHALATSRARRRVRSWRRRCSLRSLSSSSCRCCCFRLRASSAARRCASARRASSRRRASAACCCFCCSRSNEHLLRASIVVEEERAVDVGGTGDFRWTNGECFVDNGGCAIVGKVIDYFFWLWLGREHVHGMNEDGEGQTSRGATE
jgi:hypothetical protein